MKKLIIFSTLFFTFFSGFSKSQSITFKVDMRNAKKQASSIVAVRGSISPLSWKSNIVLTDADNDGFFTATVTFDNNSKLEYKYVCDEKWERGDNRSLNLTSESTTNDIWNVEQPSATPPFSFEKDGKTLTFAERMTNEQIVHGVSQIILHNDKVDTILTWGFRDVEAKLPVDANTIFHIGGMGQSLTAFAVLRAVENKRIDLEQPINEYLKTIQLEGNFTVRELLLGKIKMSGEKKPFGYVKGDKIPTLEQIFAGENTNTPKFSMGKGESKEPLFNIFAPLVAQMMLENVYQKSFSDIIEMEILKPLDMKNTFVTAELNEQQSQNASVGYDKKGNAVTGKRMIFPELGFGGVWTTPTDYAKFVSYLIKASRGENNTLLSQNLAKGALEAQNQFRGLIFPNGDDGNYLGGAATGFRTQVGFNSADNSIIVTFMNSYENWRVMLEVDKQGRRFLNSKLSSSK
jgi:CubicO group peptidase (beta-lactamase class C family)